MKRRFNSYAEYFRREFGGRVQKLSIDAGFTCPNRDGTKAIGGCSYCNNDAFNPSYCSPEKPVSQQILEGIEFHNVRYRRADNYLAYFQPYSNTYAPIGRLKEIYDEALSFENVVGLVIGTRPDCIDDEKLEYFARLSEKHYVIIEYGIESCYDRTLKMINRQQTFAETVEAIRRTKEFGIKTGGHIIFGLPGESREEMLDEAAIISELPLDTIKLHQLQIIKGTAMEKQYEADPTQFKFFELQEYIDLVINFTEQLNPEIVIERFAGEVPPRYLVGPSWGLIRNSEILVKIEKQLEARDTWQGISWERGARNE